MPAQDISLIGSPHVPSSSLSGSEALTIYRGYNAVVRNLGGSPYIENYPGSKDISENYDLTSETLTGNLSWSTNGTEVTGAGGTIFKTELRPGQWILAGTEAIVVQEVIDDDTFIAARPLAVAGVNVTAYYLYCLFEIGKKRGVLRRGNGIERERKDIIFVGDGSLFLNGVDTTYNASRIPKRLQRAAAGTYTEYPWGFPDAPPTPVVAAALGGWKGMLGGPSLYSFMFSWWNETTDGFSNPCARIKDDAGTPISLAADDRLRVDITALLAVDPTNADGIKVWGTLSGGGVTEVNVANYSTGALYEVCNLRFAAKTITAMDATANTLTIANHGFKHGDYVIYKRTGGADITGLTSGTAHAIGGPSYWVLVKDEDTIQLASSVANLKAATAVDISGSLTGTNTLGAFDNNDVAYFEYLDAETGAVVSGDNDPPPQCEWISEFAGRTTYISCFGKQAAAGERGSSPGSFIVPGKESNPEAAPYRWRVGVEEDIHGFVKGSGRLFLMTQNSLPFVTTTSRTELPRLLPTPLDVPLTWRPFWAKGSIQPYALAMIFEDLYLYSGQPLRSPSNVEGKGMPPEFGQFVRDLTKDWFDGYVMMAHDPQTQQACIVASACRLNTASPTPYWVSEILPLDLSTPGMIAFQPKIVLSSTTQDNIISGVAVVNNRFEFLAGGRRAAGNPQLRTYRYHERNGSGTVSAAVAFQPSDNGNDRKRKYIRSIAAMGKLTSPVVQIHGVSPNDQTIDPDDIENGTNSLSGDIALTTTTANSKYFRTPFSVKDLYLWSARIGWTWTDTGTNDVDRLDELLIEMGQHGGTM